jgi:alkanesulfonate monooxygenase SsuD/methylene tetrahydromethanopterin reductase-like flavin-dependent oxidoreductase (luciferase family)
MALSRYGRAAHGILNHGFYENFAKIAERGKFDMIFLADTLAVIDRYGTSVKHTVTVRPEPLTLLAYLSGVTERIGLAATVSTTYHEPYNLAREFSTLDHLSGGRAAWNVVTSGRDEEAANFSKTKHPDHERRYERAREFVEIVTSLWDSWEDDDIVAHKDSEYSANRIRFTSFVIAAPNSPFAARSICLDLRRAGRSSFKRGHPRPGSIWQPKQRRSSSQLGRRLKKRSVFIPASSRLPYSTVDPPKAL